MYGELHRQGESSSGQVKKRLELSGQNFRNLCIFTAFFLYNLSLIVMIFTWSINEEKVLHRAPVNVWAWLNNYDVYGKISITRTISGIFLGKPQHVNCFIYY